MKFDNLQVAGCYGLGVGSGSCLRPAPLDSWQTLWQSHLSLQPQRRANRRCAALSRSVQRPKGARLSAGLGLLVSERMV